MSVKIVEQMPSLVVCNVVAIYSLAHKVLLP